jgi:hypothetical protein
MVLLVGAHACMRPTSASACNAFLTGAELPRAPVPAGARIALYARVSTSFDADDNADVSLDDDHVHSLLDVFLTHWPVADMEQVRLHVYVWV